MTRPSEAEVTRAQRLTMIAAMREAPMCAVHGEDGQEFIVNWTVCDECMDLALRAALSTPSLPSAPTQYATIGEMYNFLANELDETRTPEEVARLTVAIHALDSRNPPPPMPATEAPPLPSAEPDGWEVRTFFEDGKLLYTFSFLDDPARASRIREYIASGEVRGAMTPLYRTTPPAAAQDTGRLGYVLWEVDSPCISDENADEGPIYADKEDAVAELKRLRDEGALSDSYRIAEVRLLEADAARAAGGE